MSKRGSSIDHDPSSEQTKRQKLSEGSSASSKAEQIAKAKARIAAMKEKQKQRSQSPNPSSTPGTPAAQDREKLLERLRAKRQEKEAQAQASPQPPIQSSGGINIPLHPIFKETSATPPTPSTPGYATPQQQPKENIYLSENAKQASSSAATSDAWQARRRKGLMFNRPGRYIEEADQIREQAEKERQQKEREEQHRQNLIKQGMDLVAGERNFKPDEPPQKEWWDVEMENDPNGITDLILHPIIISAPWEKFQSQEIKAFMTKKEIKRKRKLTRAEIHKEQQQRIQLGLDPAPKPKVKLSNLMNVYTNEAIKDPTAMEARVRKEVEERRQKHEQDNESRKLTPDEKWEKQADKIERDKSKGIYCAVFRIENLSDASHKYIVNAEARKNHFTGMVIFNSNFSLVVVEGGALQVKKYIKRLERINWTKKSVPKDEEMAKRVEGLDLSQNKCSLVWQGQLQEPKFSRWTLKDAETEQDAKDLLSGNNAESYWLQARNIQ